MKTASTRPEENRKDKHESVRTHLLLPVRVRRMLERQATKQGVSMSQYVAQLLSRTERKIEEDRKRRIRYEEAFLAASSMISLMSNAGYSIHERDYEDLFRVVSLAARAVAEHGDGLRALSEAAVVGFSWPLWFPLLREDDGQLILDAAALAKRAAQFLYAEPETRGRIWGFDLSHPRRTGDDG